MCIGDCENGGGWSIVGMVKGKNSHSNVEEKRYKEQRTENKEDSYWFGEF